MVILILISGITSWKESEKKKKQPLLDPQPCLTLSLNFHSLNLSQQHKPQRPSSCDTLIMDAHQKSGKETGILTVAPKPIIAKAHKHTPQRLTADIKSSQQGSNQTSSQKNWSWPIKKWCKQITVLGAECVFVCEAGLHGEQINEWIKSSTFWIVILKTHHTPVCYVVCISKMLDDED